MNLATAAPRGAARLPSLDGIRALAIVTVLPGHLIGTRNYPALLGTLTRNAWPDLAMLGVRYRYSSAAIHSFPLNLVGVFAAALASYYLVERPALTWRRRFTGERVQPIDAELASATFEREPAAPVVPAP